MRISDWSSDVCSSDLEGQAEIRQERQQSRMPERRAFRPGRPVAARGLHARVAEAHGHDRDQILVVEGLTIEAEPVAQPIAAAVVPRDAGLVHPRPGRSEEHTSELQSLMRISYAVFCLTKKKNKTKRQNTPHQHT